VTARLEQVSAGLPPVLHVSLENCNRAGIKALTPDQCDAAFSKGTKGAAVAGHGIGPSTGLGLDTVVVASLAVGGSCWLSTRTDFETGRVHTAFNTKMPAKLASREDVQLLTTLSNSGGGERMAPTTTSASSAGSFPSSESIREGKNDSFRQRHARKVVTLLGYRPLCYGLDDSMTLQMLLESIFTKLGAHPDSRALGSTDEEQDSFCDLALGVQRKRPADIVVLDTQLSLTEGRPTGIDIARRLRDGGFEGLIAIHSGLSTGELHEMQQLPYVDMVVSKGYSAVRIADELMNVFSNLAEEKGWTERLMAREQGQPEASVTTTPHVGVLGRAWQSETAASASLPFTPVLTDEQEGAQDDDQEQLSGLRIRRWAARRE
jgi:hypothetical protein